jgi:hypothetical protein
MIASAFFLSVIIASSMLLKSEASQGDLDPKYISCTRNCNLSICKSSEISKFGTGFPYWHCEDDCNYDCMQSITLIRSEKGYGPLKYYGHWPFLRIYGMEEPASVIFSILNSVPYFMILGRTLIGMLRKDNRVQDKNGVEIKTHFMHNWLVLYYFVSINCWLTSAYYHARKTDSASLVDFASALLFLGYSWWLAIRRIWGVCANGKLVGLVFITGGMLFSYQVNRMSAGLVTFDQHMYVSISIAILNVLTWFSWVLFSSEKQEGNTNYRYLCLLCQLWFSLAALLELYDFPAIYGLFDAHSLW